jgi:alkylation response protein AidB-like acyl-CoA dehydrogenase
MIDLTEEQRMILSTVRKIAREVIKPRAAEIDESQEFPWDIVKVFTGNGILTPLLPEKYGGIGASYLLFSMIIEEISKVCASSALTQADGMLPIYYGGSEKLKEKFLPGLTKGKLAAFAATEPGAGSDILSMRTRTRDRDVYVINGQKCFITNGSVADFISLYAYTDPDKGAKGISVFAVEKGSKGLIYGRNEKRTRWVCGGPSIPNCFLKTSLCLPKTASVKKAMGSAT